MRRLDNRQNKVPQLKYLSTGKYYEARLKSLRNKPPKRPPRYKSI